MYSSVHILNYKHGFFLKKKISNGGHEITTDDVLNLNERVHWISGQKYKINCVQFTKNLVFRHDFETTYSRIVFFTGMWIEFLRGSIKTWKWCAGENYNTTQRWRSQMWWNEWTQKSKPMKELKAKDTSKNIRNTLTLAVTTVQNSREYLIRNNRKWQVICKKIRMTAHFLT